MTSLLRCVLRRHVGAGGHAVLLSATLGGAARQDLIRTEVRRGPARLSAAARIAVPYPAVSDTAGPHPVDPLGTEKRVEVVLQPWVDAPDEIGRAALSAAREGARVLVVRNTVAGAVAVQRAIEAAAADGTVLFRANGVVAPHHGRFAAEDRKLLDAAVERSFGKEAGPGTGLVLVGTQTLEQSLDIDADLLLTDLAPIDVLLQRLGRLHRHPHRQRSMGFATCRSLVMAPAARDLTAFLSPRRGASRHGLGSVYENLAAIEAAWRLLDQQPTLSIPRDNRMLVEEGTDPGRLGELAEELGQAWREHWQTCVGDRIGREQEASHAALDWFCEWDEMTWLPALGERVRTRLGLDDRIAAFDRPVRSPFNAGAVIREMKFPAWLLRSLTIDADAQARVIESDLGVTRFTFGDGRFLYTRHGLQRETA
jgi:CRISPR-associated endonuclease/helicase Cas3